MINYAFCYSYSVNNPKHMKRLFLILILATFVFAACNSTPIELGTSGSIIELSDVQNVEIGLDTVLNLTQGDTESLEVIADDIIMEGVSVEMDGNTLVLGRIADFDFKKAERSVVFNLTVKDLNKLTISGASKANISKFSTEEFEVELSGASKLNLDIFEGNKLVADISGASKVDIAGRVDVQDLSLSGASAFRAKNFESNETVAYGEGASNFTIWANDDLDVTLSGASKLSYMGSPEIHKSLSAGASIRDIN